MRHGVGAAPYGRVVTGLALRLCEAENAIAVGVIIIVGRADVFKAVVPIALIAPNQPITGAAGELPLAEVQTTLDQPIIRFVRHLEAAAGRSCLKVGVADLAWHRRLPV